MKKIKPEKLSDITVGSLVNARFHYEGILAGIVTMVNFKEDKLDIYWPAIAKKGRFHYSSLFKGNKILEWCFILEQPNKNEHN